MQAIFQSSAKFFALQWKLLFPRIIFAIPTASTNLVTGSSGISARPLSRDIDIFQNFEQGFRKGHRGWPNFECMA
jgi:hypothetical protein